MTEIAVIIINYNTAKYSLECVASVYSKTSDSVSFQVIVVDNNSEPADFDLLQNGLKSYKNLKLHRSPINTGFGGGNMLGVQLAKAKYLLFLNNDAFLQNDCLSTLKRYMDENPEVGVSTAQNFNQHGEHVISFDHNKGLRKLLFGRSFLEKINPEKFPKRKKEYTNPVKVNFVNGAFMFFRASVFATVGGFDTNIFLYFEEMDICQRIKRINKYAALVPQAKITHYQGVSTGVSKTISKEGLISYFYVIKKNYSYLKYVTIRLYYNLTFLIKPKKWFMLGLVFRGVPLSESLKQKQKLRF